MEYSNAQKLAAVLTIWSRPAISQIATSKLTSIPFFKKIQGHLVNSGLVGQDYSMSNEFIPLMYSAVNSLVEPILEMHLSQLPDASIPAMAHGIVDKAMEKDSLSVFDGLITFESEDLMELKTLLNKNLPLVECERYEVIQ